MDDYEKMSDEQLDQALALRVMQSPPKEAPQDNYENLSDDQLDEMLANKIVSEAPQDRGLEAFTQGFGNAATFGYLPQIQAAVEPGIQAVTDMFLPSEPKGFEVKKPESKYLQRRDQYIQQGQQLAQENPNSSLAGNVAGAISGGIATGGAIGNILGTGTRAATFGGRLGQAAKTGAAIGAIRNPGDTEGEISPLQFGDRAKNIATDALTGAVLQGGIEGVGKAGNAIKNSGSNLKTYAETKLLKASGAMLKDFRKAFGNKRAAELGQSIADEGIVGIGDSINDIAKKAEGVKTEIGNRISSIYDKADELVGPINPSTQGAGFDLNKMARDLKKEIAEKYTGKAGGTAIIDKVSGVLDDISLNESVGFKKLKEVRSSIDDLINYSKENKEMGAVQSELRNIRNKIQDNVKSKLSALDELHGTELASEFSKQNKRYSNVAEVSKIASDKAARESSNAAFGLREQIGTGAGGAIGATIGGPVGAAIGSVSGAAIAKVSKQYGTPFVAITANKAAKALESNPKLLGAFAEPLIKAASVSPKEFVTSVNLLIKKPEFKKQLEKAQEEINSMPALGKENEPKGRSPSGK